MKKLLAITLLTVHLFNLVGYPVLFWCLINNSSSQFALQIDNQNFREDELVEIKVPLNLPYLASQTDFERYDGEITIDGRHHNYVKRKVTNDTLYLLCLPNRTKDKLQLAKADYGKQAHDFDLDKKKDNTAKKLIIVSQYHAKSCEYDILAPEIIFAPFLPHSSTLLCSSFLSDDGKPPQLNS